MVGLLLKSGSVAKEGDPLYGLGEQEGLAPWAAALSDALLASNCAACFGACPSRFPCQGSCQGSLGYCSLSCRDLDSPLHNHSGECSLLSLLQSCASNWSSFPSLGGTCDLRAALRLLAHHEALHHIAPFLATSGSRLECPRLGGLLSNRSTLLQPAPSGDVDKTPAMEEEEMEMLIAAELHEAAMLMHQARFATSLEPCMHFTSKQDEGIDYDPDTHPELCMHVQEHVDADMDVCVSSTGHIGSKHLDNIASTRGNVHTHNDVYMATNGYIDTHETSDGSIDIHKDIYTATSGCLSTHRGTHADVATSSMASLTLAEEVLLVEEVICQVFTNGVHVQADNWFSDGCSYVQLEDLGTAVYGPLLSWINHSCRPNAFYSFVVAGPSTLKGSLKVPLVPDQDVKALEDVWGLKSCCIPWFEVGDCQGPRHYGPRACLCSIGKIKGLEAVCISYVDLLQPMVHFDREIGDTRRRELWMKYRFKCACERCEVKSTNNVDTILQNIGVSDWLHEEAQHGLREFLNNDNPLSCCTILEDALIRFLHEAHQSQLCGKAPPLRVTRVESFKHYGGFFLGGHNSCSKASGRHEVEVNLHLMNRICLDIYMALSSSYKVLASGFNSSHIESSSMYKGNGIQLRKEVECSLASAIYTLILAATMQYMYDYGEPGILGIAARSWLQTGETFVNLILKLDSYFLLDGALEMQKLFSQVSGDCMKPMFFLCEKEFLGELKKILNAYGRLSAGIYPCASIVDLLRCIITSLWPVLRNASPFLSYIETPFDISKVLFGSSEKRRHIFETKDAWVHHRAEMFVVALCSLQHGLKLMNICYGFSAERFVAMQDFLDSFSHMPSTR